MIVQFVDLAEAWVDAISEYFQVAASKTKLGSYEDFKERLRTFRGSVVLLKNKQNQGV